MSRDSELFQTVLKAIRDKKGEKIVSLDLRKIEEAVADFFILCEAQSHIQVKTIADNVVEEVQKHCGEKPYHVENGMEWTLVDFVNVVVHVFKSEERRFYDLEGLWLDSEKMEHGEDAGEKSNAADPVKAISK